MNTIAVSPQSKALNDILKKARRRNVMLKSSDGEHFVLARVTNLQAFDVGTYYDFNEEIKMTRKNRRLMKFLDERAAQAKGAKRRPMAEVRRQLGLDKLPMPTPKKNGRHKSTPARPNLELARTMRILRKHLPELRERYSVRSLGVFGSYVRGEQKKRTDLDVSVEFEHPPSLLKYIDLEDYLSDLVGIKVDLVMKKTLKPVIGHRVLAEVVSL